MGTAHPAGTGTKKGQHPESGAALCLVIFMPDGRFFFLPGLGKGTNGFLFLCPLFPGSLRLLAFAVCRLVGGVTGLLRPAFLQFFHRLPGVQDHRDHDGIASGLLVQKRLQRAADAVLDVREGGPLLHAL